MNSAYGRTAIRDSDSTVHVVYKNKLQRFYSLYSSDIIKIVEYDQFNLIYRQTNKLQHYN